MGTANRFGSVRRRDVAEVGAELRDRGTAIQCRRRRGAQAARIYSYLGLRSM